MNMQSNQVWTINSENISSLFGEFKSLHELLAEERNPAEIEAKVLMFLALWVFTMWMLLELTHVLGNIRPSRFPPGPAALIVTRNHYLFELEYVDFSTKLLELAEYYGKIISLSLSIERQWDVILFDPDMIMNVLRYDRRFEMRRNLNWKYELCLGGFNPLQEMVDLGIACLMDAFETGCSHLLVRSGVSGLTGVLKEEIAKLTQMISPLGGTRLLPKHLLSNVVLSIMCRLLFNETFDLDCVVLDLLKINVVAFSRYCKPTQRHFLRSNRFLYPSVHTDRQVFEDSRVFILKHVASLFHGRDPRGNLDERVSLMEMLATVNYRVPGVEASPATVDLESPADDKTVPECVADYVWGRLIDDFGLAAELPEDPVMSLFLDLMTEAEDDVSEILNQAVLSMLRHSEVALEVYEELRTAFPDKNDVITFDDRQRLPYTRATLEEVIRSMPKTYSTYNLFATTDIQDFHGYYIEAGTRIVPHMMTIFNDANKWTNPSEFDPHNHLATTTLDSSSDSEGANVVGRHRERRSRRNVTFRESECLRMTTRRLGEIRISAGQRGARNTMLPSQKLLQHVLFSLFANMMRRFKFSSGIMPSHRILDNGAYFPQTPLYKCNIHRRIR